MIIFEKDHDYKVFLNMLSNKCKKFEIEIIAYTLMPNHFHIVLLDNKKSLSKFMKSLSICYVRYFNFSYNRTGTLFEGRFQSRCINNHEYLMTVIRYVLRNPEIADICNLEKYEYSSYKEFLQISNNNYCNMKILSKIFPDKKTYRTYISCNKYDIKSQEIEGKNHYNLNETIKISNQILFPHNCTTIQSFNIKKRNKLINKLLINNISVNDISKITGISKNIIYKIKAT